MFSPVIPKINCINLQLIPPLIPDCTVPPAWTIWARILYALQLTSTSREVELLYSQRADLSARVGEVHRDTLCSPNCLPQCSDSEAHATNPPPMTGTQTLAGCFCLNVPLCLPCNPSGMPLKRVRLPLLSHTSLVRRERGLPSGTPKTRFVANGARMTLTFCCREIAMGA